MGGWGGTCTFTCTLSFSHTFSSSVFIKHTCTPPPPHTAFVRRCRRTSLSSAPSGGVTSPPPGYQGDIAASSFFPTQDPNEGELCGVPGLRAAGPNAVSVIDTKTPTNWFMG